MSDITQEIFDDIENMHKIKLTEREKLLMHTYYGCLTIKLDGRKDQTIDTKPRPEVQWFAKRMELKLQANDHKQHWSKCHPDYLIDRLFQETDELWRAIENGEPGENVIDEAADVANFAMMIADRIGQMRKEADGA